MPVTAIIRLRASDGHEFDAYEARVTDAVSTIVILQEIFGVNPHIRSLVDMYAQLGYNAIAPALFDRVESGVELDYGAASIASGRELAMAVRWEPAMRDVAAAVSHAQTSGPVAVIGFCFGGSLAWLSANELPVTAAISYYGGQVHDLIDRAPHAPMLLQCGELDHAIPLEHVHAVAEAHPGVEVHVYGQAQHGFACDARSSFDANACEAALQRTLVFLADNGVGRLPK